MRKRNHTMRSPIYKVRRCINKVRRSINKMRRRINKVRGSIYKVRKIINEVRGKDYRFLLADMKPHERIRAVASGRGTQITNLRCKNKLILRLIMLLIDTIILF